MKFMKDGDAWRLMTGSSATTIYQKVSRSASATQFLVRIEGCGDWWNGLSF